MRGRFAPSPTGAMHLGNARTALLAWLAARHAGGRIVLRVEDLAGPASWPAPSSASATSSAGSGSTGMRAPTSAAHGPYRQSERVERYDAATAALLASGAAYLCACTRADVARAASAPHGRGKERTACATPAPAARRPRRGARPRAAQGRAPTVRFAGGGARLPFVDRVHGQSPLAPRGGRRLRVRRSDGVAAYQLAVVVDDAAMAIDEVVRGDDLLGSTPRQLALYGALGLPAPAFAHVPLVLSPGGERLAKRTRPLAIGDLRATGVSPGLIVGALGASAGLCPPGTEARPAELVAAFSWERLPRAPVTVALPGPAPR